MLLLIKGKEETSTKVALAVTTIQRYIFKLKTEVNFVIDSLVCVERVSFGWHMDEERG